MYELIKTIGNTYYIQAPAKIGLYVCADNHATLIDSGNDKEAGRKIAQHLNANSWLLKRIINTHSNADHTGGNEFLHKRTQCDIISSPLESVVIEFPVLEPSFLYGAFPPKPLRNKFLMAAPSKPTDTSVPEGFETFALPGHFFDMLAVRTPDDVLFVADSLFGEHILCKYHVSFLYDVKAYLETLNMLENISAKLFIPSHAEPCEDILPLIKLNRDKTLEIIDLLLSLTKNTASIESIIKQVFVHFDLKMDFNQYVLVGSTIKSYLAYLIDEGRLVASFEDNVLSFTGV